MKRPAFQFYPGDWLRDTALRACSLEARGLWMDMLSLMHQAEPYGHLVLNGKPIDEATLARMVGATVAKVSRRIEELEQSGTCSRREDGALYSRRMVKDEHQRNTRAEFGKLGGNPSLVKSKVNPPDKPEPTPSSASSSSVSSSKEKEAPRKRGSRLQKPFEFPEEWKADAARIAPKINHQREFERFCDHWWAVSGAKGVKEDWPATWRNWLRRAADFAQPAKAFTQFDNTPAKHRCVRCGAGTDGFQHKGNYYCVDCYGQLKAEAHGTQMVAELAARMVVK